MKSIKLKIWFSILGVTAMALVCVWLFQVVLLNQFYLMNKESDMNSNLTAVEALLSSNDELPYTELVALCSMESISLELITETSSVQITPKGSGSLLRDPQIDYSEFLTEVSDSGYNTPLFQTSLSQYESRVTLIASKYDTADGDCIILLASELAPIQEAVSSITGQMIWLSIILLLLACLVSFILARHLTQPIINLTKATRSVASGDLTVQVSVSSKDEIGTLANNFNQMTQSLEHSNRLQRELVANLSHDIRTPLTMIRGYAEMIRDLTGDNKQKREEQLEVIMDESDRLNLLANDVLDLSKLQSGTQALNCNQFDLTVKLEDVLRRYRLLAEQEGFTITLNTPPTLPVWADEIKIEQVIYNILNNAVNHTGSDKTVRIDAFAISPSHAVVTIRDTGAGIAKSDLPLIWDRYYKPYKKNDRKGMGTGLGLSIVKAILQAHQQPFGVDSDLGQGTVFWFQLQQHQGNL